MTGGGLLHILEDEGVGCIAFSPLAQGLLTDKYLEGVPKNSRAAAADTFDQGFLNEENLARVRALNAIARRRGQTLAQMAIAWVLRDPRVTAALVGASRWSQIEEVLQVLENLEFSDDELGEIDLYAVEGTVNIWAASSEAGESVSS